MSTYLVAFIITDFKSIKQNSSLYNIECEVAARPEAILNGEGDYALNQTSMVIDYFSDYFETKYPLQKIKLNISFLFTFFF